MISDEQLRTYNEQGLIPGPDDTEDEFLQRAEYNVHFTENVLATQAIPYHLEQSKDVLAEAYPLTKKFYDIAPSWTYLLFSNYKLAPWHGAIAWIFQLKENSPYSAFIQLRQALKTHTTYLHLYKRHELLAHEICHIGRMSFHEPKYEEILAYQTSGSSIQKYLGPLIQSKHEATMFMSFLLLIVLANFYVVFTNNWHLYSTLFWLQTTPLWFLLYAGIRLYRKYSIFNKTRAVLNSFIEDGLKVHAVLYRLTDKEITSFAKFTPNQIQEYANSSAQHDLRWRLIRLCYFKN
jgi:hypothetical protein